ncbi:MAG: helix-turn-helix domain-containing protein [Candidatus Cloacimonadaceae bacterium]|nr:helix-turn-helix domain-containing protein [Candidatus Cloacimonadaceae bacterium]MDP3113504.1 helix-turn-helix domain-containing protein [Candidatus Cloacimonadaceae bacterium]
MGRPKQSLDSCTLEAIEQSISALHNGAVVRKLTILSSYAWLTTEEISRAHRINPRTLFRWIKQFKEHGIEGLVDNPKGHKPAILTDEMKSQIVQWITTQKDNDGNTVFWTLDKLRGELERVYGVKISKPALSVNLSNMKLRYKRPRPTHIKADKEKQAEYKKKL